MLVLRFRFFVLPVLASLGLSAAAFSIPEENAAAAPVQVAGNDGSPMILVPAGVFLSGSTIDDPLSHATERPQRAFRVETFHIDQHEVTNAQYKKFLKSIKKNGHVTCDPSEPPERSHAPDTGDVTRWTGKKYPVVGIGWYDAAAYCAWAGKRLPSEREWEKAARGSEGALYPWGDEPPGVSLRGNFRDEASFSTGLRRGGKPRESYVEDYSDGYSRAAPVGSFPKGASPYGALDMSGNVLEWVGKRFSQETHLGRNGASDASAEGASLEWAIVKGGSFATWPRDLRAATRHRIQVWERRADIGFRCAMDAD